MGVSTLRTEDYVGIFAAIVLHVLLVAVLVKQWSEPEKVTVPERMTVSFAEDVGMTSTAPDPVAESRASEAPTLSDMPAPPEPLPASAAAADPVQPNALPPPPPRPRPTARPRSQPRGTPRPRPDEVGDRRRPDRPSSTTRSTPRSTPTSRSGTRLGDNFLDGAGTSSSSTDSRLPASQIGRSARASIVQAIARQVRPHWVGRAPSGADAEQLVTILAFELNPDGSLKGRPRVVRQLGETPSNRAQKDRHAEVAIRAVQLAAPFDLPDEYYNAWKSISGARFDRNLSR